MTYYNIHTHHPAPDPAGSVEIVNRIIGKEADGAAFSEGWYSVGIHPWYISDGDALRRQFDCLESAATHPRVVAIGEAGIDRVTGASPSVQSEVFARQAALAEKTGKPLIIHCVKAWEELLRQKKEVRPHVPWVVHGFRGNGQLAEQLLRQGFYLSFGVHFNRQALHAAWQGRMSLETDDTEVSVCSLYESAATALGVSLEAFATALEKNVRDVFFLNNVVPLSALK